jgi:hypothetical protein
MALREHEIGFREAEAATPNSRGARGSNISDEEFDVRLEQMMVRDHEGRCTIGRGGGPPARSDGSWRARPGSLAER